MTIRRAVILDPPRRSYKSSMRRDAASSAEETTMTQVLTCLPSAGSPVCSPPTIATGTGRSPCRANLQTVFERRE